jgi:hypothetical protein
MISRWMLGVLLINTVALTHGSSSLWPFRDVVFQLDRELLTAVGDDRLLDCAAIRQQVDVPVADVSSMLAHGSAKGVWLGSMRAEPRTPVIVKRPIRRARFVSKGFNESYMVDVMLREATVLRNLHAMAPLVASRLVGSCIADFNHSLNVVEYLDSLQNFIQSSALSWRLRVDVAVRLAHLLDALDRAEPYPLLMCDFTVRQFGISPSDRRPKLVDVDSLTPYRGRHLHESERVCNRTHPQCSPPPHTHCFNQLATHSEMTEFQCQFASEEAVDGFCHGFDKRTHVLALGKLLLEDLLVNFLHDAPSAEFSASVRLIIDMCTRHMAARRITLVQLIERLEALQANPNTSSMPSVRNSRRIEGGR